jgi:hypothetical protein
MIIIGKKKKISTCLNIPKNNKINYKGAINLESCPINNLIPVWLVVSGSGAILIEVLIALFMAFTTIVFDIWNIIYVILSCELLSIILCIILSIIIIFIFSIGWFFAGIYYFRFFVFFLNCLNLIFCLKGNSWIYSAYKNV